MAEDDELRKILDRYVRQIVMLVFLCKDSLILVEYLSFVKVKALQESG
jgi:hypothetical protein